MGNIIRLETPAITTVVYSYYVSYCNDTHATVKEAFGLQHGCKQNYVSVQYYIEIGCVDALKIEMCVLMQIAIKFWLLTQNTQQCFQVFGKYSYSAVQ